MPSQTAPQPNHTADDLNFLRDLRNARHQALTILRSVLDLAQADPADERAAPNRLALLREARLAASQVLAIDIPRATDRGLGGDRSMPSDVTQPVTVIPTPTLPTPPTKRFAESGALSGESVVLPEPHPDPALAPPPANPLTRSLSHHSSARDLLARAGAPP